MKRIIAIALLFSFLILRPHYSEAAIDPKQQISIILFSGLGGAILGLSTLSFYDQPQDHLRNIAVGGAIALIGSVVFTTVYAAKQTKAEAEGAYRDENDAASKAADPGTKKKKKDKPASTGSSPGTGKVEEQKDDSSDSSDEGAMLDNYKNDVNVKIFLADYSNSRFDPNFFYITTSPTNKYGESSIGFFSRVIEINF